MKITLTLQEAAYKVNSWDKFCDEFGWSYYVNAEGGGYLEQELTEEQAIRYGLLVDNSYK